MVMKQPEGQKCAIIGGIMALRMKVLGARGVVANGRVRDLVELRETGLPVRILSFELFFIPPIIHFVLLQFGHNTQAYS